MQNNPPHFDLEEDPKGIFVDRRLIVSKAYLELSGAAPQVLLIFYSKRQMQKPSRKSKVWIIKKYGLPEKIEYYDRKDELLKVATFSSFKGFKGFSLKNSWQNRLI